MRAAVGTVMFLVLVGWGCAGGSSADQETEDGPIGSGTAASGGAAGNGSGLAGRGSPGGGAGGMSAAGPAMACGNGAVTRDEACDDGNQSDGDGCSADCRAIETGYSCQPPGQPCRRICLLYTSPSPRDS